MYSKNYKMDFSTLNESNLHHTLKMYYAFKHNGETEVKSDGHIYDILSKENEVIEIQTKNLSKLLPKILDAIEKGHKVTLVHPIPITTIIELKDENENIISTRKSPKKNSIYSMFKELTGLYPVLLNENFTLTILEIEMTEFRKKMSEPIQSNNNKRRFKKDWIKTGKKLNQILSERNFKTAKDYLSLLPEKLPEEFCAKDIQTQLKNNKLLPGKTYNTAHLILWIYVRMNLIQQIEKKGKSKYYKIYY